MGSVVYTSIFGDYDTLKDPIVYSDGIDYICFTDNADIKSDFWRVVYIKNENPDFEKDIKLARYFKTNFHEYLSSYENLMWMDARITIISDINEYLENLRNKDIVFLKHPNANSIAEEFERVLEGKIERPEIIETIKERYAEFGYIYDNGLISSGVMLFKNNKKTIKFSKEWWEEINDYSHRDQLSGNFVLWRNKGINYVMLPRMINKYFKQLKRNTRPFRYE